MPGRSSSRRVVCRILAGALLAVMSVKGVSAQSLTRPLETVLLRVSGKISNTNMGNVAAFDLPMLAAMASETIETTTIWTDGRQRFTGVPLYRLMQAVGATGEMLCAHSANGYRVRIPKSDWARQGPILAFLHNGRTMRLRDKGPLWIVYPYDDDPAFRTIEVYARSIWQLEELVVE